MSTIVFNWEIKQLLLCNKKKGDFFESPSFPLVVNENDYKLMILPKGNHKIGNAPDTNEIIISLLSEKPYRNTTRLIKEKKIQIVKYNGLIIEESHESRVVEGPGFYNVTFLSFEQLSILMKTWYEDTVIARCIITTSDPQEIYLTYSGSTTFVATFNKIEIVAKNTVEINKTIRFSEKIPQVKLFCCEENDGSISLKVDFLGNFLTEKSLTVRNYFYSPRGIVIRRSDTEHFLLNQHNPRTIQLQSNVTKEDLIFDKTVDFILKLEYRVLRSIVNSKHLQMSTKIEIIEIS